MEPRTTLNARKGNGPVDGMRTQCRYAGFVMDRIKRIARMEEEVFAQRSGDAEGKIGSVEYSNRGWLKPPPPED